ncbi:MAG: cobyric acid synthase [Lachnospiraceae bacterium]|nr:cobyric acid synthase [Lachnospiraceae bacterium]
MAKNLMIQGTMSGAGKSIITAGLLRIFKQDGYRAAPFKSQNMALNSFVTADNREMGRAQVVQAIAAGAEPSSDMNPVLIKPMGDTLSQVIVNGHPVGNMKAREYYRKKKELIPEIMNAYDRLSRDRDIIVIEGAGSPVEINLRENDIVNMGLAEMLDAPVLLVGNIDPGGVFAQLLGTVNLLDQKERERVKGLIINKFRGDKSLLMPGLSMFKEYCSIPFAGVVPYTDLKLDEEDSVSERLQGKKTAAPKGGIEICVIKLPLISNYTDFSVLENIPSVNVAYTDDPKEIKDPDLLILPGTKNTLKDLKWLRDSGMEAALTEAVKRGVPLIGICGGFQMLGEAIEDRDGLEGGGSMKGLSLFPLKTVFSPEKTLRQTALSTGRVEGEFSFLSDLRISGYEIHMGVTEGYGDHPGVTAGDNVLGTYIHGFFDSPELVRRLLTYLYQKRGDSVPDLQIEDPRDRTEKELDRLADVLRENLDMDLIRGILSF